VDEITDSLDGVIYSLKEACIFDIKSSLNTTSADPRQQPDFVNEILRQVDDVSCPGELADCSGHGTCNKGSCVCDSGKLQVYIMRVCVCACVCVGSCISKTIYTMSGKKPEH